MSADQSSDIQIIVGLGNPGPDYSQTRHNVGQWFVQALAKHYGASFKLESKYKAHIAKVNIAGNEVRLVLPTVYMNESGQSIAPLANFFKTKTEQILIAHDELDLSAGTVRLKQGGGHGGHNGLRDSIAKLGNNKNFARLRLGIGHPGDKNKVSSYVLKKPSLDDQIVIERSIDDALQVIEQVVQADMQSAMKQLHTQN